MIVPQAMQLRGCCQHSLQQHSSVQQVVCVCDKQQLLAVGQLVEFVKWAQQEWPRALLSELLNLKDLDLDSVIMEKDDRKRLYRSRNYVQYGLLYEGKDGTVPRMSLPIGKMHTQYSLPKSLITFQL